MAGSSRSIDAIGPAERRPNVVKSRLRLQAALTCHDVSWVIRVSLWPSSVPGIGGRSMAVIEFAYNVRALASHKLMTVLVNCALDFG